MTATIPIKLKWGKQDLEILVDPTQGVTGFSHQIQTLTNVPADKQRLLGIPGGPLKSQDSLTDRLKPGMKLTLMGTAESAQLRAPVEATVFVEDMTPEEITRALKLQKKDPLPVGLENLGNTCYMNAVVQTLVALPELREALNLQISGSPTDKAVTERLADLVRDLHAAGEPVTPFAFLAALRGRFPQFSQKDSHGNYSQQDAEECFRGILEVLGQTLPGGVTDKLFGFEVVSQLTPLEAGAEEGQSSLERHRILLCHMGSQTEPVNHLQEGVKLSLKEVVQKQSTALNRTCDFQKTTAMTSLPQYLVVQFARFQWKARSDSAGTEATRTKIVRKCAFQKNLDVYDFCSQQLKESLAAGRSKKVEIQDVTEVVPADNAEQLTTGFYSLTGIVSHQGRSAEGGHYVGWTRWKKGDPSVKLGKKASEDIWLKFDDEIVSEHELKSMIETGGICGGLADTQMAYFCIFERETVPSALKLT